MLGLDILLEKNFALFSLMIIHGIIDLSVHASLSEAERALADECA